jgi:hypothetical protein
VSDAAQLVHILKIYVLAAHQAQGLEALAAEQSFSRFRTLVRARPGSLLARELERIAQTFVVQRHTRAILAEVHATSARTTRAH